MAITREEFDAFIDKDKLCEDLEDIKGLLGVLSKVDIEQIDINELRNDLMSAMNKISKIQDEMCPIESNDTQ